MFIYFLLLINLIVEITEKNHEKHITLSDFLNTLNNVKNNFLPGDMAIKIQNQVAEAM